MINKSLSLEFLKSKKVKIVSTKEALKDIHPFLEKGELGSLNKSNNFKKGGFNNEKTI